MTETALEKQIKDAVEISTAQHEVEMQLLNDLDWQLYNHDTAVRDELESVIDRWRKRRGMLGGMILEAATEVAGQRALEEQKPDQITQQQSPEPKIVPIMDPLPRVLQSDPNKVYG